MKNWKKVSLAAILSGTLVITGCTNNEEPSSIDEVTSSSNAVILEAKIEHAEKIKTFSRSTVGELGKIFYGIDFVNSKTNEEIVNARIKNPHTAQQFFEYTEQFIPYGMKIKKISFNRDTEKLYEQNGRYFYQTSVEAYYTRDNFSGIDAFSYFLMINKDKNGNYFVEDLRWEKGHLLDGYEQLSEQGKEYVTKEKFEVFFKNALSLETTNKETAIQNITDVTRGESKAEELLNAVQFNGNEKRTLMDIMYERDSFTVLEELSEDEVGLVMVGQGKIGVIYSTQSGLTKKEAYSFKVVMTQLNPDNLAYNYVIDRVILTPTNDFKW